MTSWRQIRIAFLLVAALGGLLPLSMARAQTQEIQDAIDARLMLARFANSTDQLLGANLEPISDALRSQLDIPAGQGLLVSNVRSDGPCAVAGLKPNDVLLTLADKQLASVDDLYKQLKAAGEAPVPLKLLRSGKPVTIQIQPIYRVTLGPAGEQKTEYYIGVNVDPLDDALRAQLGLQAGKGMLITDVIVNSPAEKAGVKKHDIILELSEKPIDKFEDLSKQVQANKDKPTTLKILRAGKPISIPIAAATRKVETSPPDQSFDLFLTTRPVYLDTINRSERMLRYATIVDSGGKINVNELSGQRDDEIRQRLEQVEKELKALHETLDKINESLKSAKPK
ncbi:MAG TPA: PDZ domain-containing protein [Gemmataceae bacterium]|nr:PDZ domain-containing protein [Gemmataceae bacterium]